MRQLQRRPSATQSARRIVVATNLPIGNPIPVGVNPQTVAVNPSTNLVYVANAGAASISVIDGASNTVVDLCGQWPTFGGGAAGF